MWVMCHQDGGTLEKRCDAHESAEERPPGAPSEDATDSTCRPGCSVGGVTTWCDPRKLWAMEAGCTFRSTDLAAMMRYHMAHPTGYNEIVVDAQKWVSALPQSLEAIFFLEGGAGEARARAMHHRFVQAFPEARDTVPLVRINLKRASGAVQPAD